MNCSSDNNIYISIILTSYNRPVLVEKLFEEFNRQRKRCSKRVEIIVIDDGSKLRPTISEKSDHIYIQLTENMGAPYARKIGYQTSSGQFIHFHDSDDSVPVDWLEKTITSLEENEPDLLITSRISSKKNSINIVTPNYLSKITAPSKVKHYLQYENCIGPLGGVTFSKRALLRCTFQNILSCQDWHMYYESIDSESKIILSKSNTFTYNQVGEDRISSSVHKKINGLEQYFYLVHDKKWRCGLALHFALKKYEIRAGNTFWRRSYLWFLRIIVMFLARRQSACRFLDKFLP
nr:glycosyltransferase family 2 protein [Roseibium sp. CAU 1639]